MNKILCLCQVAALARDFQWEVDNLSRNQPITRNCGMSLEKFNGLVQSTAGLYDEGHDNFNNTEESAPTRNGIGFLIDPNEIDRQTGTLSQSEKIRLIDLLGAW